jgi:hypothetical protein
MREDGSQGSRAGVDLVDSVDGVDGVECDVWCVMAGGMVPGGDDFQQHRSCERGFA